MARTPVTYKDDSQGTNETTIRLDFDGIVISGGEDNFKERLRENLQKKKGIDPDEIIRTEFL